ncbi:MAG: serine/threonine-protein kinase [Pirellulaceae bacterium]
MSTELIQRYELGELIGVGTVGTIYRATDRETGEVVALKKLNQQAAANRLIRERFRRETSILQRLRHPNIIAYKDSGSRDSILYYSMELVDGGTVKTLLELGGALPWPAVADLAVQLCSALQCAHNNGVIHRDLKPGNLFLTSQGQLKLGDFGIARDLTLHDLSEKGQTVGTHAYMAPEQIRGEQSLSDKADLYALGCCLFEMLTCRKPFIAATTKDLYEQHFKTTPRRVRELVPSCPVELDDLVAQLLSKSPEDRPFNARQVQARLLQSFGSKDGDSKLTDADEATDWLQRGHALLIDRIRNRHLGAPQAGVSWWRLLALAVIVVAVATAAFALKP